MGEEGAAVSAVDIAASRIRSGQSTHALVGGALNAEQANTLLGYELGRYLHRGPWRPSGTARFRGRRPHSRVRRGFPGAESREHAEKRGARAYARLARIESGNARRGDGYAAALAKLITAADPEGQATLAISGASGAHKATRAEREALEAGGRAVRAFSSLTGHLKEAQFPFAIALAALAIRSGNAYPPFDTENEQAFTGKLDAVLATTVGFSQAEGAALLTSA